MDEKTTPKPEVKPAAVEATVPETKPEAIVIKAEAAKAPEPVSEPVEESKTPEPAKVEPPKEPEPAKVEPPKLFSVKTDAYSAWVTQNGDNSYLANLELNSGSSYNWPASSTSEAEALLKYHIANQKL